MPKKVLAQRTCETCQGDRYIKCIKQRGRYRLCPACEGKGYVWVEYVLMDETKAGEQG